ncbi:unnamed protein product [Ilex paraguariensis]|uniref:SBP-type domain-containing protein n=1 Tax=Ilex paraguariensis TaxID=185542 RepID=A0ABC8T2K5_9AQUA
MSLMESWSFVSGGTGFASEESVSADGIPRDKNELIGWELKNPSCFGSNMVISSQEPIKNQGFVELGFPEMMKKSLPNGSIFGGRMLTSVTAMTNAFSGEEDSSSKLSSSVVESNGEDSSFIDLKLGRLADHSEAQNFNSCKATPNLSSAESSIPAKRVRSGGLSSSTHFCQVYGCRKDLSSSKDYHKRHKVCEVHSKTAKVIVNGIEQRFCQQCSRFHLLVEFDDGKRSCRKRLAGHNERRRKPHGGIHYGRTAKLFQPYSDSAGIRFQGTAFTTSSFNSRGLLPSSLLHPQKYEMNDWRRHIKVENVADYSPSAIPVTNEHMQSMSLFHSSAFDKQCLPFHDNGITTTTGSKFSENSDGGSNLISRSLVQNGSIGSEGFSFFNSAATVHGQSEISDSGRALSLLSFQTHNSSSHSSGIPMVHSLIIPGGHAHYRQTAVSEKFLGVSVQTSGMGETSKIHSSGISSVEESQLDPILISDGTNAVNFGMDEIFQRSEYINGKDHLSCNDEPTIDLLQLSSQLQRVEHQKQLMQMKHKNDAFSSLRIT